MLTADQLSLARQVDIVFKELSVELGGMTSGTVFIQIRNNIIGKFGIRHNPIAGRNGHLQEEEQGLSSEQIQSFRVMAVEALKYKRYWTHGEISYEFALNKGTIMVDATLESNYNMANLMIQRYPRVNAANTYKESDLSS
ncbi:MULTISPECIES: O-methyltransferase [unclassified Paenibacillus]|uniref:O-methyltransferase n=1 Tax=unclassified Paenibacillus TaxID=185978 RepID=UPI0008385CCF|nr:MULTISPECIES: O-methyltransferase [unclassified Paenibacillus]NWL88736.1 O-methyltransferase [Paenibacillus sp. 79R4]